MRWRFWGALVAGLTVANPVWAAHELDRLDLALRRAALELTAGRPADAAGAMALLAAAPGTASRADLTKLLRAESELLNGDVEVARGRLEALATSHDRFVRTQAAAHRVGLALAALDAAPDADSLQVRARLALGAWDRERADDAPLVDLAAARVARLVGDVAPAAAWLERARRGPGAPAAALLRGEEALEGGDTDAARREFEGLERQASEVWAGWAQAWGSIGLARTRIVAGDRTGARARLAQVTGASPLAAEARLYAAQLAYADHDVETAAGLLAGVNAALEDAALATEADLLRLQIALDRGAFAVAESLGLDIETQAPVRLASAGSSVQRFLELDLHAWHAARATATLKHLVSEDVLRGAASPTALAGDVDVVRVATAVPDSAQADCIVLLPLVVPRWFRTSLCSSWSGGIDRPVSQAP